MKCIFHKGPLDGKAYEIPAAGESAGVSGGQDVMVIPAGKSLDDPAIVAQIRVYRVGQKPPPAPVGGVILYVNDGGRDWAYVPRN